MVEGAPTDTISGVLKDETTAKKKTRKMKKIKKIEIKNPKIDANQNLRNCFIFYLL